MPGPFRLSPDPSCLYSRMMPWGLGPCLWKTAVILSLLLSSTALSPTSGQTKMPLETVKLWADTFGRDLYDTVTKYSGSLLLQKKYKDVEPSLRIQEVDGLELVRKFSQNMETMLRRKVEAIKVLQVL